MNLASTCLFSVILGCRMESETGFVGAGFVDAGSGPGDCTAPRSISSGNHALRRGNRRVPAL